MADGDACTPPSLNRTKIAIVELGIRMRAILAVNLKKQVVCHCAGERSVAVAHTGIQAPQSLKMRDASDPLKPAFYARQTQTSL